MQKPDPIVVGWPVWTIVGWPVWTNRPIHLFHGTTLLSAQSIKTGGVDLDRCRERTDFGCGFYTTTLEASAWDMARKKADTLGGQPRAVIRLRLDRYGLGLLKTLAFVRGTLDATDFWSYVYSSRNGLSFHAGAQDIYDVVYGPVARSWSGPANSKLYEGYDQISFHTAAAVLLLNDSKSCQMEIL